MKKIIFLVITMFFSVMCFSQTTEQIPYHILIADTTKPMIICDTTQEVLMLDTKVKSTIIKRSFGTDKDGKAITKIELENGHIEVFYNSNNYAIISENDLIGKEYEYVTKEPLVYDKVTQTINGNVDLAILYVNSYNLFDGTTILFAKVYSHTTNKVYRLKIDEYLYYKYNKQGIYTKSYVKKHKIVIPYTDYKHLLVTKKSDITSTYYDFVEVK